LRMARAEPSLLELCQAEQKSLKVFISIIWHSLAQVRNLRQYWIT